MLTMLILMVKSRFMPVGVDNSGQFGEDYMSFLAEKIVRQIDINKQNAKKSEEFFVEMERIVQVKGVALKVCLPQEEFEKLLKSKDVPKSEATQWIQKCVVGKITKAELDDERVRETNALDIMQNSSIIYHMESVLEMQMACLVMCFVYSRIWAKGHKYGEQPVEGGIFTSGSKETSEMIMIVLLVEHIIAYLFNVYRTWELKRYGTPTTLGIETAPCESRLKLLEIVADFVIILVVLIHFV